MIFHNCFIRNIFRIISSARLTNEKEKQTRIDNVFSHSQYRRLFHKVNAGKYKIKKKTFQWNENIYKKSFLFILMRKEREEINWENIFTKWQ